jgi:hypothetical protein
LTFCSSAQPPLGGFHRKFKEQSSLDTWQSMMERRERG